MDLVTGGAKDIPDFVIHDVLDVTEYTDQRVIVTIVGAKGSLIRLHVEIGTAELLCERIAEALECLYGNKPDRIPTQ